ncbi:MAG: hypothetical protein JXQ75_06295 [Phycisphaerae bacterium]|nr:hypothetical protein [Phycisphaerae bacterium]
MRTHRRLALVLLFTFPLLHASCFLSTPPEPTSEELDAGLIVIYPGVSSAPTDLINWYFALRDEGIIQAIEVVPYGPPMDLLGNLVTYERNRAWSAEEAPRIAQYMDEHPGRPVTLIGYSGGAGIAVMVAESMPGGYRLDRLLLFSSGLSSGYDLSAALDHTEKGIVHYWSPRDWIAALATIVAGTVDRVFESPAATVGFKMSDERLVQFTWMPEMARYGNHGNHHDFLYNEPWIRDYVAPLITRAGECCAIAGQKEFCGWRGSP